MRRRLLASYLLLIVVLLLVLELPLAIGHSRQLRQELTTRVERDAVALASLADELLEHGYESTAPKSGSRGRAEAAARSEIARAAAEYNGDSGARVVITDDRGIALVDTDESRPTGSNRSFATRPEIERALNGVVASGTRDSETLGYRLLYVAVPVASGGSVHGAVRVTYPLDELDEQVRRYQLLLIVIGLGTLAAAAVLGLVLSRWALRPLDSLEHAMRRFQEGDHSARADVDHGPVEMRALARDYNRMVGELDHLLTSQEQFVADASHQLRTPLTALRLRLEDISENGDANGEAAAMAMQEVDRLTALVSGLLALARASDDVSLVRTDAAAVVRSRVSAWQQLANERGARIETDVPDDELHCSMVAGGLEQVLDILIDNALEAAPAGSRVEVAAAATADRVQLTVSDEGPGMTDAEIARAFERFWQGASPGGSGLGLSIAQRLVELSGGSIQLARRSDGATGLVASVLLPAA